MANLPADPNLSSPLIFTSRSLFSREPLSLGKTLLPPSLTTQQWIPSEQITVTVLWTYMTALTTVFLYFIAPSPRPRVHTMSPALLMGLSLAVRVQSASHMDDATPPAETPEEGKRRRRSLRRSLSRVRHPIRYHKSTAHPPKGISDISEHGPWTEEERKGLSLVYKVGSDGLVSCKVRAKL